MYYRDIASCGSDALYWVGSRRIHVVGGRMKLFSLVAVGFIFGLSSMTWAQPAEKARRIGILFTSPPSDPGIPRLRKAFMSDLRERGWEEGKNVVLEERFAGGDAARFPALAAELIGRNVDVILSAQTQAITAARGKTATIPIIMIGVADPVGSGLVVSLARPGGNVTGLANQIETVSAKNVELLKEIKPGIKRIGIMFSPNNGPSVRTVKALQEEVTPRLGMTFCRLA